MLRISKCLMLVGFLAAMGCTDTQKRPEPVAKKLAAKVKPAETDVPVAVAKILPANQVNETNAHDQAKIMYEGLSKEKGQLERTESAKRE